MVLTRRSAAEQAAPASALASAIQGDMALAPTRATPAAPGPPRVLPAPAPVPHAPLRACCLPGTMGPQRIRELLDRIKEMERSHAQMVEAQEQHRYAYEESLNNTRMYRDGYILALQECDDWEEDDYHTAEVELRNALARADRKERDCKAAVKRAIKAEQRLAWYITTYGPVHSPASTPSPSYAPTEPASTPSRSYAPTEADADDAPDWASVPA